MNISRRRSLAEGGLLLAALLLPRGSAHAGEAIEIAMTGRPDGSRVWFDPIGIHLQPGQSIRWINRTEGNSHTATAYHPALFDRPRRIPEAARPWDSDYLLPAEEFVHAFDEPGVYDYYCVPHEHAGMVGRIVVGSPRANDWIVGAADGVPEIALAAFPSVEEIVEKGMVRRA